MRAWIRWRLLVVALGIALLLPYAAILGWLKWNESELVFLTAMSRRGGVMQDAVSLHFRRVDIALPEGQSLPGYALEAGPLEARGYWILHFHGNADSAFSAGQIAHAMALRDHGFHVLAFDYRGFGESPGKASEANMYVDAQAAYDWLIAQGVAPAKIILWGHSLGSGPAVELATRHAVAGVVLFGAFTSVPDRAAELYPWLPVRWVAGIHFDNLLRAPSVRVPMVIVHAETDLTIPVSHSDRLFAAANQPKRLIKLQMRSDDGFGGHFAAAYEQLDRIVSVMSEAMALQALRR